MMLDLGAADTAALNFGGSGGGGERGFAANDLAAVVASLAALGVLPSGRWAALVLQHVAGE